MKKVVNTDKNFVKNLFKIDIYAKKRSKNSNICTKVGLKLNPNMRKIVKNLIKVGKIFFLIDQLSQKNVKK